MASQQFVSHSQYPLSDTSSRDYNTTSTSTSTSTPTPTHPRTGPPPPYPLSPSEPFFATLEQPAQPAPVYAMPVDARTNTTRAPSHERADSHTKSIGAYRAANPWDGGGEGMGYVDEDGEGQRRALDIADQVRFLVFPYSSSSASSPCRRAWKSGILLLPFPSFRYGMGTNRTRSPSASNDTSVSCASSRASSPSSSPSSSSSPSP